MPLISYLHKNVRQPALYGEFGVCVQGGGRPDEHGQLCQYSSPMELPPAAAQVDKGQVQPVGEAEAGQPGGHQASEHNGLPWLSPSIIDAHHQR